MGFNVSFVPHQTVIIAALEHWYGRSNYTSDSDALINIIFVMVAEAGL